VTEVGGGVRFVRLALQVVMQNDRKSVNVILLYNLKKYIFFTLPVQTYLFLHEFKEAYVTFIDYCTD